MSALIIFGAGGHGKVVAETARISGEWTDIVFADDLYPQLDSVNGVAVLADVENARHLQESFPDAVVAIGNNSRRLELVKELQITGFKLPPVIHPAAIIAESVNIGNACVVFANAVIQPSVTLGMAAIVNTSTSIDHDGVIGSGVHLSPGVHLGGEVNIGDCSWLGVGVSVIQGVTIGANCLIGAGAAVVNDINDNSTAVGVPARVTEKKHLAL